MGNNAIPFVKPVRVGNFKLWRSRVRSSGIDEECVNISELDGQWHVRVPARYEMFSVLSALCGDYLGGDEQRKSRAAGVLSCILGNMMYASSVGNGFFHRALEILAVCYANPSMLRKDDAMYESLSRDVGGLIDGFLAWREEYDRRLAAEPSEEDMKHEDIAEQAERVLEDGDTVEDQGR